MPGAVWDPGLNAGYRRGRTSMQTVKVHCTAGNNSYGICKDQGLIQWLFPYEGPPWQFAEADAWCFDSGPYNGWGPGFEIERPVTGGLIRPGLSEFRDLSDNQVHWLGELVHWLHDEWGFRIDLYAGPRYGCSADFGGFVNHGDIESQRSDGVTVGEWAAIVGTVAPPVPIPVLVGDEMAFSALDGAGVYWRFAGNTRRKIDKVTAYVEAVEYPERSKVPFNGNISDGLRDTYVEV